MSVELQQQTTPLGQYFFQGIIDCKRTETQHIFPMFVMTKKLELFVFAFNGITASVRCVSSIIIVLNAKLTRLIAARANKKDSDKQRTLTRMLFFASWNT